MRLKVEVCVVYDPMCGRLGYREVEPVEPWYPGPRPQTKDLIQDSKMPFPLAGSGTLRISSFEATHGFTIHTSYR